MPVAHPKADQDVLRTPSGNYRIVRKTSLQIFPQAPVERMPHFALVGFCAVFDLGEQLGLNPDAAVRDLLRVGLRLADQACVGPPKS